MPHKVVKKYVLVKKKTAIFLRSFTFEKVRLENQN